MLRHTIIYPLVLPPPRFLNWAHPEGFLYRFPFLLVQYVCLSLFAPYGFRSSYKRGKSWGVACCLFLVLPYDYLPPPPLVVPSIVSCPSPLLLILGAGPAAQLFPLGFGSLQACFNTLTKSLGLLARHPASHA